MTSSTTAAPALATNAPAPHPGASTPEWSVPARTTKTVLFVCWLAILFEGYDVGVMGAVLPTMAEDRAWMLSPLQLGVLSSYALVGMFFGAFFIGTLSDLVGRRGMLLMCVSLFSLTMIGAALAPTPFMFGVFRFIGGLGLGGVIPVAAALTIEYSPPHRRSFNYGVMYSGYSFGILSAALLAIWLVPHLGWRGVIGAGVIPLLAVPFMARMLPESMEYLIAKGRHEEAARLAARFGLSGLNVPRALAVTADGPRANWKAVLSAIFAPRNLRATVFFWIALFLGMLLVYGLNTWLPQIMRKLGYDLGSSLLFLAVFSLASAIGGLALGAIADKIGPKRAVAAAFLLGAGAILGLMQGYSLWLNYVFVALAGIGSISASLILTGYLADYYPAHARGTATGWALGFARVGAMSGPLLGGYIAGIGRGAEWNFIAFALAAVVAGIAVTLIPKRPSDL